MEEWSATARASAAWAVTAATSAAAATHYDVDLVVRPVPDHRAHLPTVRGRKVHATRPLEVAAEALAHLADGGCVHHGRERFEVVQQSPEEKRLITVLQRAQVHVLLHVVRVLLQRVPHFLCLRLERELSGRQQATNPQPVALVVGKARPLVCDRVVNLETVAESVCSHAVTTS